MRFIQLFLGINYEDKVVIVRGIEKLYRIYTSFRVEYMERYGKTYYIFCGRV